MRVLMTADAVGGVWTYALELVAALAEREVEVVLAVIGPPPAGERRRQLRDAPIAGYHERNYALEWMPDGLDDVADAGAWLCRLCEDEDADLVHLNAYAVAAAPFAAPAIVVAHSCVLSWHDAVRRTPAGREWSRYGRAVEHGLSATSAVVAPTRAMLAEIERLYRPRGERLVIANGRASDTLRPLAKEPFVLGVGRVWDEAKNLLALDRVAPRLDWPIAIAGGGSGADVRAARLVDELSWSELADTLGRASIFAAPARYEPFGLAALEAGLAGCALVLGDIPSLREVWGETAVFVDPFDDEALAAALLSLIAQPNQCADLGRAARRRALEYTPGRMADAYLELYERQLSGVPVAAGAEG